MSNHHDNRNDLSEEHALTDVGQIICLFAFVFIWVLDSFILRFSIILSELPVYIKIIIAVPLFIISLYAGLTSHQIVFKEKRDPPSVINNSVFKWIRHPMYMSELLVYLGLCVITFSLLSFTALIIIFIFFNHVASDEEKKLEEKYGNDYLNYKKETGKWFPKLWK